jgi:D-aspartate ligase
VRVIVAQDDHWLAGHSRFARGRLSWPATEAERVRFLLGLAVQHGLEGWTLIPTADDSAALLSRHHGTLRPHFRLTTPPWDIFQWAFDKRLLYRLAERHGVDHPRTFLPLTLEGVREMACSFPVIVKPAFRTDVDPFTSAKAWAAPDRATLLARYEHACTFYAADRVMVQELVPGGGEHLFSFAAMCIAGEPRAWCVVRRSRQWPTDFGQSSSFVETCEQPEVEASARRILAALRLDGIVEVEFRRDPRNGALKLLDVNVRAWGWHSIGRAAGVDFPYLLWSYARGEKVPELRGRPGVRWVRALTDVPAALAELRAGRLSPIGYLRGLVGRTEFAILALDDPLPALLEVPMAIQLLWRRRRRELTRAHRAALRS